MHGIADIEPLGKIIITLADFKSAYHAFVRTRLGFHEVDFRDIDCGHTTSDTPAKSDQRRFRQALREYLEHLVRPVDRLGEVLGTEELSRTLEEVLGRFEVGVLVCKEGMEEFEGVEGNVKEIKGYKPPKQCLIDFYINETELDIPNVDRLLGTPATQYIRFEDGETFSSLNLKQRPKQMNSFTRPEFNAGSYQPESFKYVIKELSKKYRELVESIDCLQDIKRLLIDDLHDNGVQAAMTSSEISVCFPNIDDLEQEVKEIHRCFSTLVDEGNILDPEMFVPFYEHLERYGMLIMEYLAVESIATERFQPFAKADVNSDPKKKRYIQILDDYLQKTNHTKAIDITFMKRSLSQHLTSLTLILTRLLSESLPPTDPRSTIFEKIHDRTKEIAVKMDNAQTAMNNQTILFALREKMRTSTNSLDDVISAGRSYLTDFEVSVGGVQKCLMVFNDLVLVVSRVEPGSPKKKGGQGPALELEVKLKLDQTIFDDWMNGDGANGVLGMLKKPLSQYPTTPSREFSSMVHFTTRDSQMMGKLRHVISTCQYLGDKRALSNARLCVNEQSGFRIYSRVFEKISDIGKLRPSAACILCCSDSTVDLEAKLEELSKKY
ncbi:hypothetical protein HDU67_001837, partial [Dinochytrium kinnereticum]